MELTVQSGDALSFETGLLVYPVWADTSLPPALAELIEADDWTGKAKQAVLIYPRGSVAARRVLLVGLGKPNGDAFDALREAAALGVQRAREVKAAQYALAVPSTADLSSAKVGQALAEGSLLGLYSYDTYKSGEPKFAVGTATLITAEANEELNAGVSVGAAIAAGVAVGRDLANRPGNDLTPARLAEAANAIGERFQMKMTVLDRAKLEAGGFGGILAVGQGSANEPRLIVMEHGNKREGVPTICLVGKGITFDSGGISIKPAENMDQMKMDMGGAAAVVGAMHVVGALNLPLHVVGLVGSAENMPSATAYRPGDIVRTLSGKTIEVLNTDAEGRIVLADVLHYAGQFQPDAIIDLATLTGAIMVALGPHATGMFSNDDRLAERLTQAGHASGDQVWRLPIWEPYHEMVKSDIADVKNTAGRYGGAITAATFLAAFVGEYPWAHLDIAGTAWVDRAVRPSTPKGATGVGVRLLVELLRSWQQ
jgi:leucyl aminopeptidase